MGFAFRPVLIAAAVAQVWLGFLSPAAAETISPAWIAARTARFELYTPTGAEQAVAALQKFEQVRSFFAQLAGSDAASDTRLRIIAFSSQSEYAPYRLNKGACAYYQRSGKRNYIVLSDLQPEHAGVALHEYTHFMLDRSGLKLPVWLNEGLADVYSSLEFHGSYVLLGAPLSSRLYTLKTRSWLRLSTLLGVTQNAPYYTEPEQMSIFYAQSWGLADMLMLGEGYSSKFCNFLSAVSSGTAADAAFELVYGRTLDQIDADLRAYVRRQNMPQRVFRISLDAHSEQPAIAPVSQSEIEIALASLLASSPRLSPSAQAKLAELTERHPDAPEIEESLGYMAMAQNRTTEARAHFAQAVKCGSSDADTLYYYARLEAAAGAPAAAVISLLERVLALAPGYDDARLELGFLAAQAHNFTLAVSALSEIKTVPSDRAYSFYYMLAYCHIQMNEIERAREYGERAGQYVQNPSDQRRLENLLLYISQQQHAGARRETGPVALASTGR